MKRFTVRWLAPMTSEVIAGDSAHAQEIVVTRGVLPNGSILQGIYASDGPVPEQFGGPPAPPPPSTTPLRPKPIGGGQPGASGVPSEPEKTEAVAQ